MQTLILYYNRLANYAFDACMVPLTALGRWAEVLGVAVVLGIVVSLIFAVLVRGERLRQARDELWAALFEIWLYRREPLLVWQAQLALLKANLRYSSILLVPVVLSLLASAPLLIQAHYRFALAPIPSGAETLLTAVLAQPSGRYGPNGLQTRMGPGSGCAESLGAGAGPPPSGMASPTGGVRRTRTPPHGLWADRGVYSVRR